MSIIIAIAVMLIAALALYIASRPSTTLVVTEAEVPLMEGRARLVVLPDIPADGAIYSPLAALVVVSQGIEVPYGSACYGLVEDGLDDVFTHVFLPDDDAMWRLVFDSFPEAVLLYDPQVDGDAVGALAGVSIPFQGRVGEVGAERIAASLEEMGAEVLALPSPHNASVLLRDWDGTLIVPAIHMNAFENGQDVVAFGEDFEEMRRIMDDADGGIHVAPYRMIE